MKPPLPLKMRFYPNKWQGVTTSFQMGGQGHLTSIHTPTSTPRHKHTHTSIKNACFPTFLLDHYGQTDQRTDERMDRWTKPLYALSGQMVFHPCVLQDIGPLGPLPCSHSTSSANHSKQGIGYRWQCAILGWLVSHVVRHYFKQKKKTMTVSCPKALFLP